MSKTTVIIFHINEKYSLGFHKCFGAPELYYQLSAGNIYECFVRKNKITNTDAIIDILATGMITDLVHVVPNGDYIENWKSNLTIEDFLNAKIDEIDIIHDNYKIKYCLPKQQIILENSKINEYYEIYKSIILNNSINEIHNVKCLVWKAIKNELREKKNSKFN